MASSKSKCFVRRWTEEDSVTTLPLLNSHKHGRLVMRVCESIQHKAYMLSCDTWSFRGLVAADWSARSDWDGLQLTQLPGWYPIFFAHNTSCEICKKMWMQRHYMLLYLHHFSLVHHNTSVVNEGVQWKAEKVKLLVNDTWMNSICTHMNGWELHQ